VYRKLNAFIDKEKTALEPTFSSLSSPHPALLPLFLAVLFSLDNSFFLLVLGLELRA
jgi:hypothetical protein